MSWRFAIDADALREGEVTGIEIEGRDICLYRLADGFYATDNICTHHYALLSEGFVEGDCIECPLHQGRFDIRTGRALCPPVTKNLQTFATKLEDGRVYINLEAEVEGAQTPLTAPTDGEPAPRKAGRRPRACFVILGAGQAGARAAEALRSAEFEGEVILVGDEKDLPYERPPLSKEVLLGSGCVADCTILPQERYRELDITLHLGAAALSLDVAAHRLALNDGTTLKFDKLLIATGARARRHSYADDAFEGIHYLRSNRDAQRLADGLADRPEIVVIGGGYLGLEVASSAIARGCAVTVVEQAPQILGRSVSADVAALVARRAEHAGLRLLLGAEVARIEGKRNVKAVRLTDGRLLNADLVVVATGSLANYELAAEAGLSVAGGVIVDAFGRTSAPAVFAAGDVASYHRLVGGHRIRLESWQNAQDQAVSAARTMAGLPTSYDAVPSFWSDQFGLKLQMVGFLTLPGLTVVRGDAESASFSLFRLANGMVQGVFAINDSQAIRWGRRLIDAGTMIRPEDLADPTSDLAGIVSSLKPAVGGAA